MKSIFGLEQNIVAALSYIFGPISGIAVLIMERENKYVRFHAMQATIWFLLLLVIGWLLAIAASLPIIGLVLGIIVSPLHYIGRIVWFLSLVFLMFKSFNNEKFKLPIIGDIVWAQISK